MHRHRVASLTRIRGIVPNIPAWSLYTPQMHGRLFLLEKWEVAVESSFSSCLACYFKRSFAQFPTFRMKVRMRREQLSGYCHAVYLTEDWWVTVKDEFHANETCEITSPSSVSLASSVPFCVSASSQSQMHTSSCLPRNFWGHPNLHFSICIPSLLSYSIFNIQCHWFVDHFFL